MIKKTKEESVEDMKKSSKKQGTKPSQEFVYKDFVDFFQKYGRHAGISFNDKFYIFADKIWSFARELKEKEKK